MATTETDAEKIAICNFRAGRGAKVTLHSAAPGTTGANVIATTPASVTTTWGGAAIAGGLAEAVGSVCNFQLPAGTTAAYVGISNGSTFLRGYPLDSFISSGAGALSVDITPKTRYNAA